MHGLFGHATEQFLENTRHTEFPLHQIADKHHQVLAETLEHEQVCLHIVDVSYILLDGVVDFLEESVWKIIDFNQHFLAFRLFSDTQLVVLGWNLQSALEHGHVRKEIDVRNADVGSHYGLIVYSDQRHEVFHATYAWNFIFGLLFAE